MAERAKSIGHGTLRKEYNSRTNRKSLAHSVQRILYFELQNTGFGLKKRKDQRATGLWSNQVIRRWNQRFRLGVLLSVSRNRLETNEREDNGEGVSRNDSRMCLRKELLHRCLFGLLENSCTSPGGIYYRYGKVVLGSTWGKQKRKSNIGRIDGIPLFVMPVVSLHTPF
jgi:hypothetical protein